MLARTLKILVHGVALSTAAITIAHPTSAQERHGLEIAPALGAYLPTSEVPLGAVPLVCVEDGFGGCRRFFINAKRAIALGGRARAWLNSRDAFEGSLWYSPSGVTGFLIRDVAHSGTVLMASVRYVCSLAPHARTMSALLIGGPALALRLGAYDDVSFRGVFGIALDIHPGRHFSVRTGIEDFVSLRWRENTARFRQDFVLSLSMSRIKKRSERS